jgi:hypothetical protein
MMTAANAIMSMNGQDMNGKLLGVKLADQAAQQRFLERVSQQMQSMGMVCCSRLTTDTADVSSSTAK